MFVLLSPLLALIALAIRFDSPGPILFRQERIGLYGRPFGMFKFRTMVVDAEHRKADLHELSENVGLFKIGEDPRVTRVGRRLRKNSLDELPQFYNVVRGEMSIVGPRPKVVQYAAPEDLPYRPGITGPATIAFRQEEELFNRFDDPEEMDRYYKVCVMPLKSRIDRTYMRNSTFSSDLRLILLTAALCLWPKRRARTLRV